MIKKKRKHTVEIYTKNEFNKKHFWHAINTFISLKQSKINIDNEMRKGHQKKYCWV